MKSLDLLQLAREQRDRLDHKKGIAAGTPLKIDPTFLVGQVKAIDWDSLTASKMANQLWGFGERRRSSISGSRKSF